MYTINLQLGTVTRDSDSKIISPCESAEDPDFVAYIAWVTAGNQPTIIDNPNQ